MRTIFFEVTESPEGGFEASAVGHKIHTEGDTWDELKGMVLDAVRCHFKEGERPALIRLLMTRGRGPRRLKLPRDWDGRKLAERLSRLDFQVQ